MEDFDKIAQQFGKVVQHADIVSVHVGHWYRQVDGCPSAIDLGLRITFRVRTIEASALVCAKEVQELADSFGAKLLIQLEYGQVEALNDLNRVNRWTSQEDERKISALKLRLWLEYMKGSEFYDVPGPNNATRFDTDGTVMIFDSIDRPNILPSAMYHDPKQLSELHNLVMQRRQCNSKSGVFERTVAQADLTRCLERWDEAASLYELLVDMVPSVFGLSAVPGVAEGEDLAAWTRTLELRRQAAECFEKSGQVHRACLHLKAIINMFGPRDAVICLIACSARLKLIELLLGVENATGALVIGKAARVLILDLNQKHDPEASRALGHLAAMRALFEHAGLGDQFETPSTSNVLAELF